MEIVPGRDLQERTGAESDIHFDQGALYLRRLRLRAVLRREHLRLRHGSIGLELRGEEKERSIRADRKGSGREELRGLRRAQQQPVRGELVRQTEVGGEDHARIGLAARRLFLLRRLHRGQAIVVGIAAPRPLAQQNAIALFHRRDRARQQDGALAVDQPHQTAVGRRIDGDGIDDGEHGVGIGLEHLRLFAGARLALDGESFRQHHRFGAADQCRHFAVRGDGGPWAITEQPHEVLHRLRKLCGA